MSDTKVKLAQGDRVYGKLTEVELCTSKSTGAPQLKMSFSLVGFKANKNPARPGGRVEADLPWNEVDYEYDRTWCYITFSSGNEERSMQDLAWFGMEDDNFLNLHPGDEDNPNPDFVDLVDINRSRTFELRVDERSDGGFWFQVSRPFMASPEQMKRPSMDEWKSLFGGDSSTPSEEKTQKKAQEAVPF